MIQKRSHTRGMGDCTTAKIFLTPRDFSANGKGIGTAHVGPTFNLFNYRTKGFSIDRVKMAVLRAKQDYGKAFEKLAAED